MSDSDDSRTGFFSIPHGARPLKLLFDEREGVWSFEAPDETEVSGAYWAALLRENQLKETLKRRRPNASAGGKRSAERKREAISECERAIRARLAARATEAWVQVLAVLPERKRERMQLRRDEVTRRPANWTRGEEEKFARLAGAVREVQRAYVDDLHAEQIKMIESREMPQPPGVPAGQGLSLRRIRELI